MLSIFCYNLRNTLKRKYYIHNIKETNYNKYFIKNNFVPAYCLRDEVANLYGISVKKCQKLLNWFDNTFYKQLLLIN